MDILLIASDEVITNVRLKRSVTLNKTFTNKNVSCSHVDKTNKLLYVKRKIQCIKNKLHGIFSSLQILNNSK